MKFFDLLRTGLKNIGRQKMRSFLTILAVVIGATSVVATLTIAFTAKNVLFQQVESAGALTQITVSSDPAAESGNLFNLGGGDAVTKIDDAMVAKLAAIPHVNSAEPILSAYNLRSAALADDTSKVISINQPFGIPPGKDADKQLLAGRNLEAGDSTAVLVGSSFLKALGFQGNAAGLVGKRLTFRSKGYNGLDADLPKPPSGNNVDWDAYQKGLQEHISSIDVTVVGVLSSGLYADQAYFPISFIRQFNKYPMWQQKPQQPVQWNGPGMAPYQEPEWYIQFNDNFDQRGYDGVIMKADSTDTVAGIADRVKALKLGAATAQEMIDQFLQVFRLVALVLGAIGAISLFVAAIGVVNTMIMATLERTREIGLLRATGATRSTVRRLFTFEASLLGFLGGLAGIGVAYGAIAVGRHFGTTALAGAGVDPALIYIPLWLAAATVAVTTFIGMVAGLLPAIRASRLNPVEALRYE